ncbi:substrate-binding domain-containing protein [Candidatus Poribacteria bacterium]|nr:substrate-binding domain-containing protein [Candidatus Poribacteria bacterium]
MRKILSLLLILLALYGCEDREQQKIKVAFVGKAKNSYWNDIRSGAEKAAERLGVNIDFHVPKEEDPAWQIKKIEELIKSEINAIAFAPSDSKSIAPTVLKAMQSGIPCAAIDTDVVKSRHVYIGTGNYHAGDEAGKQIEALIPDRGKIAILTTSTNNLDILQRIQGFRDTMAEFEDIEIITALEKEREDIEITEIEAFLNSHNDLKGIFCASNRCGVITAEAVENTGKTRQIKIVSIGESPEIMDKVRQGIIQTTIARKPYSIGFLTTLVLHNMVKAGISNTLNILPKSAIIDTGIVVVTPMNILQYRENLRDLGLQVKF